MRDARADLELWAKRRFWIISLGSAAGLFGALAFGINTIVEAKLGDRIQDATVDVEVAARLAEDARSLSLETKRMATRAEADLKSIHTDVEEARRISAAVDLLQAKVEEIDQGYEETSARSRRSLSLAKEAEEAASSAIQGIEAEQDILSRDIQKMRVEADAQVTRLEVLEQSSVKLLRQLSSLGREVRAPEDEVDVPIDKTDEPTIESVSFNVRHPRQPVTHFVVNGRDLGSEEGHVYLIRHGQYKPLKVTSWGPSLVRVELPSFLPAQQEILEMAGSDYSIGLTTSDSREAKQVPFNSRFFDGL